MSELGVREARGEVEVRIGGGLCVTKESKVEVRTGEEQWRKRYVMDRRRKERRWGDCRNRQEAEG